VEIHTELWAVLNSSMKQKFPDMFPEVVEALVLVYEI
jgi:hypothetical protein